MDLEQLTRRLRQYFASQDDVAAASVVGSFAAKTQRPDSDVDVLVVLSRPAAFDPLTAGRRRVQLAGDLEGIAERRVDVILLDACSPVLAFHLLQNRSIIIERDHDRRLEAESRQIALYQDASEIRDMDVRRYLDRRLS